MDSLVGKLISGSPSIDHFPFGYFESVHFGLSYLVHISLFGKSSKLMHVDFLPYEELISFYYTSSEICLYESNTLD